MTPPDLRLGEYGIIEAALDPSNPYTVYVAGGDTGGLWKSLDGGATWEALGVRAEPRDGVTTYLYNVYGLAVNPCDPQNLYATSGVRGSTLGFWVSNDGGRTWRQPRGFQQIAQSRATFDVTSIAVDPTDFKHVLLGSHSGWRSSDAGILETHDGGESWTAHDPNPGTAATPALHFLYDPEKGIGDAQTWLFAPEGDGFWRTTDGGQTWKQVSRNSGMHGGFNLYRAKNGALYSGGAGFLQRSNDNGETWESLSDGLPNSYYFAAVGDGERLYTSPSCACGGSPFNNPYFTSSEDDGKKWTPYEGGKQTFGNGPFTLEFQKSTGIVYAVQWASGVWALKVK